ncbi:IS3 family transposase (plasmid) [Pseudalkalibacillus hwajinpoensis]|uniref:IS3 family transposase n=1 Tax=Guptibacillus hwajinpoensis TaxID=208199 RepID=UPI00325AB54A
MESLFGHMKDEIDFKSCFYVFEVKQAIREYMNHHNNERYQWSLKKMTLVQYRGHLLAV